MPPVFYIVKNVKIMLAYTNYFHKSITAPYSKTFIKYAQLQIIIESIMNSEYTVTSRIPKNNHAINSKRAETSSTLLLFSF